MHRFWCAGCVLRSLCLQPCSVGKEKNMPERAARGGTMQQQRRRRLSIGTATAAAVAAAAAAAAAASAAPAAEGFHVAPAQLARGTRRAEGSTPGQADGCCYSRLRRPLGNSDGAGGAALALGGSGGGGTGLCFCPAEGAGRGGRSVAPARASTGWATPPPTVTRTAPAFSRQNERRHSRVGSHAGGGWPRPTAASQHRRRRRRGRAAAGRGGEGLGERFSASSLTMAAGRGGDGNSFRKRGDLPSLVVGAGLLLARTRSSQRADHERREVAVNTGAGGGRSSLDEEEAAVVAEVGSGAQRPAMTAASTGLTAGAGESSSSSAMGLRRSGGGGGARQQQQQRRNSNPAPDSLEVPRQWRGNPAEWEEMGEWRQQGEGGGAEEMEMSGAEDEWTEVREAATQETELRRRQQRLYREGEQQQQQRQQSRSVLASSSSPLLEVSLDRSVMPEPIVPPVMWGTTTAAFLGVVAVTARIPRLLGAVGKSSTVTVGNTLDPVATPAAAVAGKLASAFPGLRYGVRLWASSLGSWASRRSQQWAEAFGPEAVVLPANDWSVCTLLEKVREGDGGLYRYRFGLPSSPDAVLPLELGQELTLCGLDASNQVVQGNYVPLTPRKQRGTFEVVVMKATDGDELDDGLPTTRSNREFSRFLDNLPLGDEIAVKPGRAGLVYGGANQPITDLVLVANGVGVVPMIQMVNELLPSSSSSVASACVVWLNEKAEDFALYSELEKAFFRNHRKLDVSCIVERDLFGSHLEANANVNAASPEFKIGTLAAVAGPDFFTRKVTDYLVRRGYPEDAIISL